MVAAHVFGKSLVYQFPPVFLNKTAIVISPLKHLMENQVIYLQQKGIKSCLLKSVQETSKVNLRKFQVVYLTTEYLSENGSKTKLEEIKDQICLIAFEECHFLSPAMVDYRCEYRKIIAFTSCLPGIPIIALTATATNYCVEDVSRILHLDHPLIIKSTLHRENIQFLAYERQNDVLWDSIKSQLKAVTNGCAIVYIKKPIRNNSVKICEWLISKGISCKYFHEEMSLNERREILRDFSQGSFRMILATTAVGKEIDMPHVRTVIYCSTPKNLETYYKFSSQAGRDGKPANYIVFWKNGDLENSLDWIKRNDSASFNWKKTYRDRIRTIQNFLKSSDCLRMEILKYFDEFTPSLTSRESCCSNCLETLLANIPLHKMYREIDKKGLLDITVDARLWLNLIKAFKGKLNETEMLDFLMGLMPIKPDKSSPLCLFGKGKSKNEQWWIELFKILKTKKMIKHRNQRIVYGEEIIFRNDITISRRGMKFLRRYQRKIKTEFSIYNLQFLTKTKREYYIEECKVKWKPRVMIQEQKKVETKTIEASNDLFKFGRKESQNRLQVSEERSSQEMVVETTTDEAFPGFIQPLPTHNETAKLDDGAGCSSWSQNTTQVVGEQDKVEEEEDDDMSVDDMEEDEHLERMSFKAKPEIDLEELLTFAENRQFSEECIAEEFEETDHDSSNRESLIKNCSLNYALKLLSDELELGDKDEACGSP